MPLAKSAQTPVGVRKLAELAKTFYRKNYEANEAKRQAEAARKALYKGMVNADLMRLPFKLGPLPLVAERYTPERLCVDPRRFKELVSENVFWNCVSISQKAVEEAAGKEVLAKCLEPDTDVRENVVVKPNEPTST